MVKSKQRGRKVIRSRVPAKPIIQLGEIYAQINEIIKLTNSSPSLCILIASQESSIVISKYKNSVKLDCDIPGILMGFTITKTTKDGKQYYVCTVSGGESWYFYENIITAVSEINFNSNLSGLDESNASNLLMLFELISETYNNLLIVNGGTQS